MRGHGRHGHRDREAEPAWLGHRHGRRRRLFDHGELRIVILKLIADKPSHGYELIKAIEDRLGGAYSPSPGVIYPTLNMLEELGHIAVETADGRKCYAVTAEGARWLAENGAAVAAVLARMDQAGATLGRSAPIQRAMENLRTALRLRMQQGPVSETQLRAIAAAIDGAATTIERT